MDEWKRKPGPTFGHPEVVWQVEKYIERYEKPTVGHPEVVWNNGLCRGRWYYLGEPNGCRAVCDERQSGEHNLKLAIKPLRVKTAKRQRIQGVPGVCWSSAIMVAFDISVSQLHNSADFKSPCSSPYYFWGQVVRSAVFFSTPMGNPRGRYSQ